MKCEVGLGAHRGLLILTLAFLAGRAAPGETPAELPPAPPTPLVSAARRAAYPPIPLAPEREREAMDAAFGRFPKVDRGEVMALLEAEMPEELYEFRLRTMRDRPDGVEYLSQIIPDAAALIEMRTDDPSRYESTLRERALNRDANRMAALARRAKAENREALLAKLRDVLARAFDARQDLMRAEVAQMARELDDLRELVEQRATNRAAIIDRRVDELTGKGGGLSW